MQAVVGAMVVGSSGNYSVISAQELLGRACRSRYPECLPSTQYGCGELIAQEGALQ